MAAEAWGRPPWEIEEQAPAVWMDRFAAFHNAKATAGQPKGGGGKGRRLV